MSDTFGKRGTVNHISELSKLAQQEYKRRHNMASHIHWELCGKDILERIKKWYEQTLDRVIENKGHQILCNMNIQCVQVIEDRRPDNWCSSYR